MINISTYKQSDRLDFSSIDKDDSLLIIGKGGNESRLAKLYKPIDLNDARNVFGDSELIEAYSLAVECGATNIYLLNCFNFTDFITSIELVAHYNFSFIVPIGINMSEKFYLEYEDRDVYFAEYYLSIISQRCNSIIIMTDEHYGLYKDIDSYLVDMHRKVREFKISTEYLLEHSGRNLVFCLNNINDIKYSNVYLAATMCNTNIGMYPKNKKGYKSDIYINSDDIYIDEIVYFRDNFISGLSIENLKNFRVEKDANKILVIDRVIKYLERHMDTSFVVGKTYDLYIKLSLHDYVDNFLRKEIGRTINNYKINGIDFYKSSPNSLKAVIDFNIMPINSLETINMNMEV